MYTFADGITIGFVVAILLMVVPSAFVSHLKYYKCKHLKQPYDLLGDTRDLTEDTWVQ